MPYFDYYAYINSPEWAAKKATFFASGAPESLKCYICRSPRKPGFHVHHLTYDRLGAERLQDLVLICPACHERVHQYHKNRQRLHKNNPKKKVTLWGSTKRLRKQWLKDEAGRKRWRRKSRSRSRSKKTKAAAS